MQGASRNSLGRLTDQLPTEGDLGGLSGDLFAVVTMLGSQPSLRRALSDPAATGTAKVSVVDGLLNSRLGDSALEMVRAAVRSRWSQSRDLVDALEEVAVDAALITAQTAGTLDAVEDELFRFDRILVAEPTLRDALTNRSVPTDAKRALLHKLLDGKVNAVTYTLIERVILEPRGRTIDGAIRDMSTLAAKRRQRLIAHVTSAVELTADEQRSLSAALSTTFGHELQLQMVVDASLIGGLTVRVGDELIDASVARQLDEARRKLTGRSSTRSARA
ncbi:MAG TPA: F0F1 ATP synthase subunit delta [Mycobacteriales bacterium]|jgi:F-type H+-transporting ATPase subunit delta|nr:F0F1 ATP synthase subunit delta [Mycobacteriales bacterium]